MSEDLTTILLAITIASYSVWYLFNQLQQKINRWPPGPLSIPGIGNLLQVFKVDPVKPYNAFHKLAKRYGPVMTIQLGTTSMFVISGYKEVKEVLHREEFLPRFLPDWFLSRTFQRPLGILFGAVPIWKETRKFTLRNLRDVGFGNKLSMESLIVQEISEFVKTIPKEEPYLLARKFDAAVVNSVFSMLCGFRFDLNDPELITLLKLLHEFFNSVKSGGANIINIYPFLAKLTPTYYLHLRIHRKMENFFRKIIADTRNKGTYRSQPESLVDAFVQQIDEANRLGENQEIYSDENLIVVLYDFFMAGAETTSTTLEYLVLHLIRHPHVQAKMIKEIDTVIGRERHPCYEDQARLPYTHAVVLETLRITTALPLGPRAVAKTTTLGNHTIPHGHMVAVSYYSVHMDEIYWGDPHSFRPERFINAQGEIYNTERLMPFSQGKRACIGEKLARMTLFLFTARLYQLYDITEDPSSGMPTDEPCVGITVIPQPYKAVFKPRAT